MGTTIKIIPPGGKEYTVRTYEQCRVTLSATDRAGSFILGLPDTTGDLVDRFPVGSDVEITQDESVFRGWVMNPPKLKKDQLIYITIEGLDYTARTQKIIVTESYVDTKISDIVLDLFTKYAPEFDTEDVMPCDKRVSIKFPDVFLWDAMEKLSEIAGYEWYVNAKLPEEIPEVEATGWAELVTHTFIACPVPSSELYPSSSLFPC
ncbi:MAG: hypothetical protein FH756_01520 [Firmicutes bacterium]|nr:hypothetical protein [Bacillota bacterium]